MPTSLVLERKGKLSLRDIDLDQDLSPTDVRIAVHTVGVCGSDVHYYTHGKIGPFVVTDPMVLGHEASGTVIEVGSQVSHLKIGDRVCMEPGIPDQTSRASKLGIYRAVLGDAAGPRLPDAAGRASGRLHLSPAGQRVLCRRRYGRTLCHRDAGRDAGAHPARRYRPGPGGRSHRHDDRPGRPGRGLRQGLRGRSGATQAGHHRRLSGN